MRPEIAVSSALRRYLEKLNDHLITESSLTLEHFRFNERNRLPGESIPDYVALFRHLSRHCEFATWLDSLLCDWFVCGLSDVGVSSFTSNTVGSDNIKKLLPGRMRRAGQAESCNIYAPS